MHARLNDQAEILSLHEGENESARGVSKWILPQGWFEMIKFIKNTIGKKILVRSRNWKGDSKSHSFLRPETQETSKQHGCKKQNGVHVDFAAHLSE